MTRTILLYPLVLATFPVVFLAAENTSEAISFAQVFVAFAFVIIGTILLILLLRLFIKDSAKVSAIASILLLVFFTYGHIQAWMVDNEVRVAGIWVTRQRVLLPVSVVSALVGIALVLRYGGNLVPLMQVITAGTLILIGFNLARIGLDSFGKTEASLAGLDWVAQAAVDEPPDIYYILLDGYGRADVLKEIYAYDNSEFIDSLARKGFYVALESRSNYVQTSLSLSSSLNMKYLEGSVNSPHGFLSRKVKRSERRSIADNSVLHYVKSVGYKYVHFDSGQGDTQRNEYADVEYLRDNPIRLLLNDYSAGLLKSTMVAPLGRLVGLDVDSPFDANRAMLFHSNMRDLQSIPDMQGPTFTFLHSLPPHPPYVFDRHGNAPTLIGYQLEDNAWQLTDLYIDQLIYVNETIENVVNEILARSSQEPVIIIQSDHGPAPHSSGSFDDPSEVLVFERTGIFNAYYLPSYCRSGLYPTISPVNTFRLVFDNCLGSQFGLLEDKTYWSTYEQKYNFSLVN